MAFRPLTDPVDYVVIAGQRTPGLAEIVGLTTPREFDERRAFGTGGALLRFRGIKLARFKIVIRLYSDEDWDAYHEFKSIIARPENRARLTGRLLAPPLQMEHPILADLGVTSAVIENVTQPTQTRDGEWTIEVSCIEFRRPVIQLQSSDATPEGPETENQRRIRKNEITLQEQERQLEAGSAR